MNKLYGKINFKYNIILETGLHIGGSKEFSAIGAVDSPVIRDAVTKEPYIPGSSIKGKMRYLLARIKSDSPQLKKLEMEDDEIKRLFGSSVNNNIVLSRLQFFDAYLTKESLDKLTPLTKDAYLTEVKYENTIDRLTSEANPRQIERVPRGAEFELKFTYNIEKMDEVEIDLNNIQQAILILRKDYLGGSGTRGYGRIAYKSNRITTSFCEKSNKTKMTELISKIFYPQPENK